MMDHEIAIKRLAVFLRDVVEPAVFPSRHPLVTGACLLEDPKSPPLTPGVASRRRFRTVEPGWTWGPKWATCWFRLRGRVPEFFQGAEVTLRFSSGTEALLWTPKGDEHVPERGFDVNRDSLIVLPRAQGGERLEFLIEAACNHPFGVTGFEWDDPEVHARWNGPNPGRLLLSELAVYERTIDEFSQRFAFVLSLAQEQAKDSPLRTRCVRALEEAERAFLQRTPIAAASEATKPLEEFLRRGEGGGECIAVGHAHLDTAWLWPLRETRRKCLRTFSNVLSLMDQFPKFRFLCSQAQHYAWVEEQSPDLFRRITRRVREGRWEPQGAMWVEPDLNVPSGESIVRQIQHADRYWRSRFGEIARQRMLFLPDTFGFPASIPQIMRLAGLDTFVTNKLHWNSTNVWPHVTWKWKGIDDSEVLAHNTPGADYNAVNTPKELRRGMINAKRTPQVRTWLQPFGYGDGGGGPTERSIRFAELSKHCDGLPSVSLGGVKQFLDRLQRDVRNADARGERVPTWKGELYLELHRGTLTSQAWIKRANRRAEDALFLAELLLTGCVGSASVEGKRQKKVDGLWRTLLLNQFHDILPGSSIGWVYDDARLDFEALSQSTKRISDQALTSVARSLSTKEMTRPFFAVNPSSAARREVVDIQSRPAWVEACTPLGVSVIEPRRTPPRGVQPVRTTSRRLSNGVISAAIDSDGCITSLCAVAPGAELCDRASGKVAPMNRLMIYEDRPHMWDAWDIDANYETLPLPLVYKPSSIRVTANGGLRGEIQVTRKLGERSRIVQTYRLDAGSPRLDIVSRVEWNESHKLLRALFPTSVRSDHITCEIQFGHNARPTKPRNTWDAAKFEFCAHRFVDLSMRGKGMALLNDCKYGHSCKGGTIGLSLLRSPKHPDPNADMGVHEFTYSLMPHAGNWRMAGVLDQADALNRPLLVRPARADARGSGAAEWSPVTVCTSSGSGRPIVSSITRDVHERTLVRLYEAHGAKVRASIQWHMPTRSARVVDLLGNSVADSRVRHDATTGVTSFALRPFEILTLEASPTSPPTTSRQSKTLTPPKARKVARRRL